MPRPLWLLALLVIVIAAPASAQDTAPSRTPWGAPDIGGMWDFLTKTPMERPEEFADTSVLTKKEVAEFVASATERGQAARLTRPGGEVGPEAWAALGAQLTEDRRTSLIVDPADGKIPPLLPDAQEDFDARQAAKSRPVRERVVYGSVAQGHDARIIPLDRRPHLSQEIRQWRGDPRSFWDGETLVVDSMHFTDKIASFDKVLWKAVGSRACRKDSVAEDRRADLRVRVSRGKLLDGQRPRRRTCQRAGRGPKVAFNPPNQPAHRSPS